MATRATHFFWQALVFNLICIVPVFADTAPADKSIVNKGEEILKTITVTARKRAEDVRDIPMSISVFSDTQIEDAGIGNVKELTDLIPNLHMKRGASNNVLIIRGISNDADFIHSTTGMYVDDINYSLNFMHNPALFDIERVEVLRGPQGTLYGRNSESGVINIVTRQPDNHLTGRVYGETGVYDPGHTTALTYRAGMSLSGPVVKDRVFMGVAGEVETSDGFVENVYTGNDKAESIDRKNARFTTRWLASDRLEIGATLDVLETDDNNGNKRFIEGPWATSPYKVNYDTDTNVKEQDGDGQAFKIKYRGDRFDLLSVTGRRFYENHMLRDSRCTPVDDGINDLTYSSDLLSQEIRITSPDSQGRFKWLGGLYMFTEDNITDIDIPSLGEVRDTDMETRGYAVFGQGTLTVLDRLHLTAGLRYSYDDMEGEMDYSGPGGSYTFGKSFTDDVFLPKFSAAFDLTPGIMTYATVAMGYNAGGFNTAYAKSADNFDYAPEYSWNYELGLKSAWLNNRLTLNLALFYIMVDDKQVPELDGVTDVMTVRNAAEARSKGVELECLFRPARGLDLFAGLGYTDAEFDEWTTPKFDYAGNALPNAPELTGNIGVQYRHGSGFFGRTDLMVTDDYYSDALNSQKVDGRTLVNLRVGYEGENWDAVVWCKNLFNEEYQTAGFARKFDQAVDGDPRVFGLTLTYYF